MEEANSMNRAQFRGYLFEIVVGKLLEKNHFMRVDVHNEPGNRIKEERPYFTEFRGRGCWHQIDCPYDYEYSIPFSYPLRLLGEVKFYQDRLSKDHIREFVGTLKDIQENYFTVDDPGAEDPYPRKLEFGVYFAANGFNKEAEKLAYAQGVKTISYRNNPLIYHIKRQIQDFSINYFNANHLDLESWSRIRNIFDTALEDEEMSRSTDSPIFMDEYEYRIAIIARELKRINASFIGTTATGVFIHFVSESSFPNELFISKDVADCRVFFTREYESGNTFWLEFSDDPQKRMYFFTPPEYLDKAALLGKSEVLDAKQSIFRKLYVNVVIGRIKRSLALEIDTRWLDEARASSDRRE